MLIVILVSFCFSESSMNLQAKVSHLEEEKEAAKKEVAHYIGILGIFSVNYCEQMRSYAFSANH